jgi:gamma-butyrobetaine dioxygenase
MLVVRLLGACNRVSSEPLHAVLPQTFELLSTRLLNYTWQGRDGVMLRGRHPSLQLAHDGTLEAIHLDSRNMSMAYAVAESDVAEQEKLLGMVCKLFDYVNRPEYTLRYMLRPGDMVVFDNRRMLHGRDAFDIETGARRLHGCYMERDMIASTHRAIEEKVDASVLFQSQPEFARSTDWSRIQAQTTAQ